MKIGNPVAIPFDSLPEVIGHPPIRIHIEEDRSGVADQAKRPAGDYASAGDACRGVHPKPPKSSGEQQADDDEYRYSGICHHMDHGSAHIVIAVRLAMCVLMLFEDHRMFIAGNSYMRHESMRLRNFLYGFEIPPTIGKAKLLTSTVRPNSFDRAGVGSECRARFGAQTKARRHPILEHLEYNGATGCRDSMFILIAFLMAVAVPMAMAMFATA